MDASTMDPGEHQHSSRRHSRRRHSRGNVKLGQIYLVVLLLLDRIHDFWIWVTYSDYERAQINNILVRHVMIDTALFVFLICRQGWARYALIFYHLYRIFGKIVWDPAILEQMKPEPIVIVRIIVSAALELLVVWALICWADIRRVGARGHE